MFDSQLILLVMASILCLLICVMVAASRYHYFYLNVYYVSMAPDLNYFTAVSSGQKTIEYYRKGDLSYQLVTKFYPLCQINSCTYANQFLTVNGSVLVVHSPLQSVYRIYYIENQIFSLIQSISFVSAYIRPSSRPRGDYLLISNNSYIAMYLFDHSLKQYLLNYSYSYPSFIGQTTYSTDASCLVTLTSNNSLFIYLRDGNTYTRFQNVMSSNLTWSTLSNVALEGKNGSYSLIFIIRDTSLIYYVLYYRINANSSSFIQILDSSNTYYMSTLFITANCQYLAVGVSYSFMNFYKYNSGTGIYGFQQVFNFFMNPTPVMISEDSSFIFVTFPTTGTAESALVFFQCQLQHCLTCSWFGYCSHCQPTFTVSNGSCVCNSNTTLLNSICISCQIYHCSHCSSPDLCSRCQDNFLLDSNKCLSGTAVAENQASQLKSLQGIVIVLLIGLAIISVFLIVLIKKISALEAVLSKVSPGTGGQGQLDQKENKFQTSLSQMKVNESFSETMNKVKQEEEDVPEVKMSKRRRVRQTDEQIQ